MASNNLDDEQIQMSRQAMDYIGGWLVMDATKYHDVLTSMKDMKNETLMGDAIEAAIDAYNGGARDG